MAGVVDDGQDMMLKIKDLDTGAEITLEEFERKSQSYPRSEGWSSGVSGQGQHISENDHQNSSDLHKPPKPNKGGLKKAAAWLKKKVQEPSKKKGESKLNVDSQPSTPLGRSSYGNDSSLDLSRTSEDRSMPILMIDTNSMPDSGGMLSPSPLIPPTRSPRVTAPAAISVAPSLASSIVSSSMMGTPGRGLKQYSSNKSNRDLSDIKLVQELKGHDGVVWVMAFSRDGKYLASGGQDGVIRVWEVQSTRQNDLISCSPDNSPFPEDHTSPCVTPRSPAPPSPAPPSPLSTTSTSTANPSPSRPSTRPDTDSPPSSSPAFKSLPFRQYFGHTEDVLDLCWSHSRFLLSGSVDQSVRLWHLSVNECLRVFWHQDFVSCVRFHPTDPQMFASGSIDGRVRVWSIPEAAETSSAGTHEMVTALAWGSDGKTLLAGTMKGHCRVYTLKKDGQLDYLTQLDVRHQKGGGSGKKITGIELVPRAGSGSDRFLITSNDSRMRMYNAGRQYVQECKYKGHKNSHTQIRASLSASGEHTLCGSDDGWVFVWDTIPRIDGSGAAAPGKNSLYEAFRVEEGAVTATLFAPGTVREAVLMSLGGGGEGKGKPGVLRRSSGPKGSVIVATGFGGVIRVFENVTSVGSSAVKFR